MSYDADAKQLFEELMAPIPVFVRPMVKKGIEAKIAEQKTGENATVDDVIRGFLLSAPKNMLDRTIQLLQSKNIDISKYEDIINEKKEG